MGSTVKLAVAALVLGAVGIIAYKVVMPRVTGTK